MGYLASTIVLCLREGIRQLDILHKEKDKENLISTLQRASFCTALLTLGGSRRALELGQQVPTGTQGDIGVNSVCEGLGALGLFGT